MNRRSFFPTLFSVFVLFLFQFVNGVPMNFPSIGLPDQAQIGQLVASSVKQVHLSLVNSANANLSPPQISDSTQLLRNITTVAPPQLTGKPVKPTPRPTVRASSLPTIAPTALPTLSPNNYPTYSPNFQLIQAGINYHNGPVMTGNIPIYLIWYGDWSGSKGVASSSSAQQIITDFLSNLGGSPWLNIQTTYTGPSSTRVSNQLYLAGTTTVAATSLTLDDVAKNALIQSVLNSGALPANTNAQYFIIPSQDISDPNGSCTTYCGYHTSSSYKASAKNIFPVRWGFITHPDSPTCANQGCYYYNAKTANGIAAADGMVSVLAHEITEAATDPDVATGWYDSTGYENADKCAWTYGTLFAGSNGYLNSNMVLGSRTYLIQMNWVNAGSGSCSVSYGV